MKTNPLTPEQFAIRAWAPRALFCDAHFRADPYSYAVLPPSAAKGLLRAIYWKPEFEYEIDEIHVIKPIRYDTEKHKSVKTAGASALYSTDAADRTLQTTTLLIDVDYIIVAHIVENPLRPREPHLQEFLRRVERGEHFQQPHAGRREFTMSWELLGAEWPAPLPLTRPLGSMLLDMFPLDLGDGTGKCPDLFEPVFFPARLENGTLRVPQGPYLLRRDRTFAVRNRAHPTNRGSRAA